MIQRYSFTYTATFTNNQKANLKGNFVKQMWKQLTAKKLCYAQQ